MINLTIDDAELSKLLTRLQRAGKISFSDMKRINRKAAQPVVEMAEKLAPVDTGNLTLSIDILRLNRTPNAIVGPKTGKKAAHDGWYARLLEYGTRKMAKRPFMRPAYEATKGIVIAILKREYEKLIMRKS